MLESYLLLGGPIAETAPARAIRGGARVLHGFVDWGGPGGRDTDANFARRATTTAASACASGSASCKPCLGDGTPNLTRLQQVEDRIWHHGGLRLAMAMALGVWGGAHRPQPTLLCVLRVVHRKMAASPGYGVPGGHQWPRSGFGCLGIGLGVCTDESMGEQSVRRGTLRGVFLHTQTESGRGM